MSATLFKYLPPDRVDVLENLSLRCTQFSALNDPFEAAPAFDRPTEDQMRQVFMKMVSQEVDEQMPGASEAEREKYIKDRQFTFSAFKEVIDLPSTWQNAPATLQQDLSNAFGAICLGGVGDSLLMWSHYSDSLRGYVIEFDAKHPQFRNARLVEYSESRPRVKYQQPAPDNFYYIKFSSWAYEAEHRMFMPLKDCEQNGTDKYGTPVYLLKIDPASVLSVIFGEKIPEDKRSRIVKAFVNHRFPNARLKVALRHESEYKIEFEDVVSQMSR